MTKYLTTCVHKQLNMLLEYREEEILCECLQGEQTIISFYYNLRMQTHKAVKL